MQLWYETLQHGHDHRMSHRRMTISDIENMIQTEKMNHEKLVLHKKLISKPLARAVMIKDRVLEVKD